MEPKDEFLRYLRSVFVTVLHAQVSHNPYCILVTPSSYMDHPEVAYPTIMSTQDMAATENMAPARPRKSISWTLTPEFTVFMLSGVSVWCQKQNLVTNYMSAHERLISQNLTTLIHKLTIRQ